MNRPIKGASNKRRSMKEAIADAVKPGSSIVIEGFTHLIGFAAGHEIIRQGIRDLTGIRLTPDLVYDQMLEAGCFKKIVFSWAGNPGVGSLHALRRRTQKDSPERVEVEEYTHFGLLSRFLAGSAGLPFWPLDNFRGTSLPESNPNIKSVECPYTGKILSTVPAIHPDVAIIHVQRADIQGNCQVWGLMGTQKESAFASKKVVVVAEEIIDTDLVRRDPNRTLIPGVLVDHVVHEPWGAHPSYAQGFYDRDNEFYVKWDAIARDPKKTQEYFEEFIYGVKDRAEYCKKADLDRLRAKPRVSRGVDYGY